MNPCTVGNTYKCERDCRNDRKIIQVLRSMPGQLGCAAPACNGKSVREGTVPKAAPGSCLTSLIRFTVIIPVFRGGMPGMCRSRTTPRGEFLWQGSRPDRDVVMVPVRAFHADPVYGVAHPVDLESRYPGQEVERDFSLGYGFTLRHLYAGLRLPGDIPFVPCHHHSCRVSPECFSGRAAGHRFPVSPSSGEQSGPGQTVVLLCKPE